MASASGCPCPLPVAAEINRGPAPHRQADNTMRLIAVADATGIFLPGCFLGVADQIWPGDVVVMPKLAAAQA